MLEDIQPSVFSINFRGGDVWLPEHIWIITSNSKHNTLDGILETIQKQYRILTLYKILLREVFFL